MSSHIYLALVYNWTTFAKNQEEDFIALSIWQTFLPKRHHQWTNRFWKHSVWCVRVEESQVLSWASTNMFGVKIVWFFFHYSGNCHHGSGAWKRPPLCSRSQTRNRGAEVKRVGARRHWQKRVWGSTSVSWSNRRGIKAACCASPTPCPLHPSGCHGCRKTLCFVSSFRCFCVQSFCSQGQPSFVSAAVALRKIKVSVFVFKKINKIIYLQWGEPHTGKWETFWFQLFDDA